MTLAALEAELSPLADVAVAEWDRHDTAHIVTSTVGLRRGAKRTHCHRGHPFTGANTIRRPDGSRECRACHNERERQRLRRLRARRMMGV